MNAVEARHASIVRNGTWTLRDVTVAIVPGELRAIVGPNGSGKSTLLRVLSGIWPTQQGEVFLDEQPIARLSRKELSRRVALVPQEAVMDFAFTVEEVVAMGRHPRRGRLARESAADRTAVEAALKRCDISHLRDRPAGALSGGERQRVLIARSLAVEPDYILLDEPTANLDIEHSLDVLELCSALACEGKGIALASHDLNAVARNATSVILIEKGRMVDCGPGEEVLRSENVERVFKVVPEIVSSRNGRPVFVFHRRAKSSDRNNYSSC